MTRDDAGNVAENQGRDVHTWFASQAILPKHLNAGAAREFHVARDVTLTVSGDSFVSVEAETIPTPEARILPGVAIPGFANTHSHAFHRALRGHTHCDGGTFWTWREDMYEVAANLTPENYFRLAQAVFAEMVLAGMTSVGEFHYVHHDPSGRPYDDAHAMERALLHAAESAGIRIALLDTAYLAGGLSTKGFDSLQPVQQRFSDGSGQGWVDRACSVAKMVETDFPDARFGAAIHSVRAVPGHDLKAISRWLRERNTTGADWGTPVHAHVSEQPAENKACRAFYQRSPLQHLADHGVLGPWFTAVHATHITPEDIRTMVRHGAWAGLCPTTERDLADGIGPAADILDAGARLSLGSDQHAVIDMFEEVRGVEMNERLASLRRGRLSPHQLWQASTAHRSLGFTNCGALAAGQRADVVVLDDCSVRTAGADPLQVLYCATSADVMDVAVAGEFVVQNR